ncbi:hypothetical protein [Carnobacterium mobile]|uniref:hypothetical protein n=1 Tax=Carnobacterium mobile TaxID=2750 RepID=UPI001867EE2C|nr:hypothetical protein [Carnobacterium mobile]
MKYYGIRKNRNINYISLKGFKLKSKIEYLTEFDKEKKKIKEEMYRDEFLEPPLFEKSNQIPDEFFYEPGVMIATDLVAKENINQLKSGLKKIILKYSTKKFLSSFSNINEIKQYVENLNENITDNQTWINLGRFDFSSHPTLDKEIAYFDIKLLNFSSSFIAIQFIIFMSNEQKRKLTKLINEDYKGNLKQVTSYYGRKRSKSGARKKYTVTTYDKDSIKNIKISEFTTELKWVLFNQVSKYIPTLLHRLGTVPPSVNIFKTNISLNDKKSASFLNSIGYDSFRFLPISESSSIIIDPLTDSLKNKNYSDYTYIVNTEFKEKHEGYLDMNHQIVHELEYLYLYLMKTHILKVMSNKISSVSSFYRNKVNNVRIKKKSYKKLLTLRYAYEKDTNIFKRLFEEIDWENEKKRLESFPFETMDNLERQHTHAYKVLTEYPFIIKGEIEKYQNYIKYEIENKLTLTSHLKDYKDEGRNHRLNIINILISTITFLSLLFPSIPIKLANQLKQVILFLSDF